MTPNGGPSDELQTLLDQFAIGELTVEQAARLEELATADPEICDYYVRWACTVSLVRHQARCWSDQNSLAIDRAADRPETLLPAILLSESPAAATSEDFGGNTLGGAIGYLSSGWPAAYLLATVVVGIGFVIGAITHTFQPQQLARDGRAPTDAAASPRPTVACITGMVDCRWQEGSRLKVRGSEEVASGQWPVASKEGREERGERRVERGDSVLRSPARGRGAGGEGREIGKSRIPNFKSLVVLGDTFSLASGLLEITYNSGAKVILQGPVTYEVDSAAGGFLSIGRLTACIEKTDDGAGEGKEAAGKSEGSDSRPTVPGPMSSVPLFAIRTPTATVTDLGTEFGVEVDRAGIVNVHVFAGEVATTIGNLMNAPSLGDSLKTGETRTIEPNGSSTTMRQDPAPEQFVRAIPRSTPSRMPLVKADANRPPHRYGWRDGDWGGIGWGTAWRLVDQNAHRSYFIGAPDSIDKKTADKWFGVCASSNQGAAAEVVRYFAFDDLPVGATFMIDFACDKAEDFATFGGTTGFGLHNAKGEFRMNLCDYGSADYRIWDDAGELSPTGVPYSAKGLHVEITRTGTDGYDLKLVRLDDGKAYDFRRRFINTDGGSDIKYFRHWNSVTAENVERHSYFKNLQVLSPPTDK